MPSEKEPKKDFIIKDRRFSAQEEQKSEVREMKESFQTVEEAAEEPSQIGADDFSELPEINFMTFVMSLNASAMVHLGIIEDPVSGKKNRNLALGKQTIDILGMIEEKTHGNLSKDEENMLKNILYDLRIIFVKEKS
jgi:hypothetical protein